MPFGCGGGMSGTCVRGAAGRRGRLEVIRCGDMGARGTNKGTGAPGAFQKMTLKLRLDLRSGRSSQEAQRNPQAPRSICR